MSHEDLDHGSAAYLALTGVYHARRSANPPPSPNDVPTYGAVLRRVRPSSRFVYDAVHVNGPALVPASAGPGQDGGFLGRAYRAAGRRRSDRRRPAPFRAGAAGRAAAGAAGRPAVAQANARPLRGRGWSGDQRALDLSRLYAQAYADARLAAGPRGVRPGGRAGDSCATATAAIARARRCCWPGGWSRRACRTSTSSGTTPTAARTRQPDDTDLYGWDTHNDIFDALQNRLLPRFDQSFSALIEDLDQRGLLGPDARRLHGRVRPCAAGGAGAEIRRRDAGPQALGHRLFDRRWPAPACSAARWSARPTGSAREPITERYGPWDVAATMFHALGIDPHAHYIDPLDRPQSIATGQPIAALYG